MSKYCGYLTAPAITTQTKSQQSQVDDVAKSNNTFKYLSESHQNSSSELFSVSYLIMLTASGIPRIFFQGD
jgi:hypothetical protein